MITVEQLMSCSYRDFKFNSGEGKGAGKMSAALLVKIT